MDNQNISSTKIVSTLQDFEGLPIGSIVAADSGPPAMKTSLGTWDVLGHVVGVYQLSDEQMTEGILFWDDNIFVLRTGYTVS